MISRMFYILSSYHAALYLYFNFLYYIEMCFIISINLITIIYSD